MQEKAKELYGNTKEYKEFESKKYTNKELEDKRFLLMNIFKEFGKIIDKGITSESLLLVKKLQDFITENYYKCNDQILLGLGNTYVNDSSFKENIDKYSGIGTAEFVKENIYEYLNNKGSVK